MSCIWPETLECSMLVLCLQGLQGGDGGHRATWPDAWLTRVTWLFSIKVIRHQQQVAQKQQQMAQQQQQIGQ